jgi:hypothetical protein
MVAIATGTDLSVEANRTMRISPWNALDGDLDHRAIIDGTKTQQPPRIRGHRLFCGLYERGALQRFEFCWRSIDHASFH